jgi:hypothetical protein
MIVRGEIVCDVPKVNCMFNCLRGSGKCLRCCLDLGFVHGNCMLIRMDLCYCCRNNTNVLGPIHRRQQPQTTTLTPTPHFLNAWSRLVSIFSSGKFRFSVLFFCFIFDLLCKRFSSPPCIGSAVAALFIKRGESLFQASTMFTYHMENVFSSIKRTKK